MTLFNTISLIRATVMVVVLGLFACGGGGSGGGTQIPPTTTSINLWTWMSGSDVANQSGVYGTKGTADAANVPGGREGAVSWTDSSGNLWLFGGTGYGSTGVGRLNDLWKFDGTNWIWVSGSDVTNQSGVYGTQGVADAANVPGGREAPISWIDGSDNLWLFGGNGNGGVLNDLWKFDGTNWTWVSGSDVVAQNGVYESAIAADNVPGPRLYSVSWKDSNGNLWLFGGYGVDANGSGGMLNDLWKYDGTYWTWQSGNKIVNQGGVYGTQGTADVNNIPGARQGAISWTDSSDNLWLFGGYGADANSSGGMLNDLWKYDGTNWTWVSGSDMTGQTGVYGTKGMADAANVPGARSYSVSWTDSSDNLWLFGGKVDAFNRLNDDLWKFDGANWTWVSGSDIVNQSGDYGTQGTAADTNVSGARRNAVSWIDSGGDMLLFGGNGYASPGTSGYLNDLWRYQP